ncbi:MAG: hypothetical protein GF311_16640 [Candidatus Lokiarchaeota archaeon]|nr:hypothetical protein [Candidatus Lokiarchaeota archaeon]
MSDDKLVIVWESNHQDGDGYGIYATIIDASTGMNITREFRVNNYSDRLQQHPEVCALSEDSFAVTWSSSNQDPDGTMGIYMSIFSATTAKNITAESRVNDFINYSQSSSKICALSNNKFVIVWQSQGQNLDSSYGIYAKVFDSMTGVNLTGEFQINNPLNYDQKSPSICALAKDKFAVTWSSENQDPDGTYGVYATVVNATTGFNITSEFRANYYTDNGQASSSICSLSEDILAITWYGDEIGPSTDFDIFARVFNASTGENITQEFRVNHFGNGKQWFPSICSLSDDFFIISWGSEGQDPDGSYGVYATVFSATMGTNITAEFRVNNYTDDAQRMPSIASLSEDRVAFAWASEGQDPDGSYGVYSRVFFFNSAPEITNPGPYHGQSEVDLNPTLQLNVSDANGQDLTVRFYDNTSGTPSALGFETVSGGESEVVSLTWSDLDYNTEYKWYVLVSDGLVSTTSAQFSFTTKEEGIIIPSFLPMIFLPLTAMTVFIAGIYISRKKTKDA